MSLTLWKTASILIYTTKPEKTKNFGPGFPMNLSGLDSNYAAQQGVAAEAAKRISHQHQNAVRGPAERGR